MLGILTLTLGTYGVYIAYQILRSKSNLEVTQFTEKKYYLLGMIAIILLSSRVINVLYFYYVLVSLIPVIPGAMCPYGVLNTSVPGIGLLDLFVKMIVPFGYITWLFLDHLNKTTKKLNLTFELSYSYILIMFPLLLLDSILDWIYFWYMEPVVVNCCRDVYNEATNYIPLEILGPDTALLAFLITVVLLFSIVFLQYFQKAKPNFLFVSFLLSIVTIPIFLLTLLDFISPIWIFASKRLLNQDLGTPHHCPFCLLKRWWTMAIFVLLVWIGLASIGWQMIIKRITGKDKELAELALPMLYKLRITSIMAIIIGLVAFFGHLVFFRIFNLT